MLLKPSSAEKVTRHRRSTKDRKELSSPQMLRCTRTDREDPEDRERESTPEATTRRITSRDPAEESEKERCDCDQGDRSGDAGQRERPDPSAKVERIAEPRDT